MDCFEHLEVVENFEGGVLLDTCFLIKTFEHDTSDDLLQESYDKKFGITTFNADEFNNVAEMEIKAKAKVFFDDSTTFKLINAHCAPGNRIMEAIITEEIPGLKNVVVDLSDAVLLVTAINAGATKVITLDKKHLLNPNAVFLMKEKGVEVTNHI